MPKHKQASTITFFVNLFFPRREGAISARVELDLATIDPLDLSNPPKAREIEAIARRLVLDRLQVKLDNGRTTVKKAHAALEAARASRASRPR